MPIRVGSQRYDLVALLPSGVNLSLRPALTGLQYEEQVNELSMRLQARFDNMRTRFGRLHEVVALATRLVLYIDWGEGWRHAWVGKVIDWSFNDGGEFQITAYDDLYDMTTSEDQFLFEQGESGLNILRHIFTQWGVPLGLLQGPYVAMPKLRLEGTIANSIFTVLTEAFYSAPEGQAAEFVVRARIENGGTVVDVMHPGLNTPRYHITPDLVISYEDQQSISDLLTEVLIYGEQDDKAYVPAETSAGVRVRSAQEALVQTPYPEMRQFGRRRALIKSQESDDPDDLNEKALTRLEEKGEPQRMRSLTTFDVPQLRKGDLIRVTAGTMDSLAVIAGISHNADDKTMTLTFNSSGTFKHRFRRGERSNSAKMYVPSEAGQTAPR